MSKLEDIQKSLASARMDRARLRQALKVNEGRIEELEMQQDFMEQAIAVIGNEEDARSSRIGAGAVEKALQFTRTS